MCYIVTKDSTEMTDFYIVVKVNKGEYKFTYRTKREAMEAAVIANEAKSVKYSTTMESHLNAEKMEAQREKDNKKTIEK